MVNHVIILELSAQCHQISFLGPPSLLNHDNYDVTMLGIRECEARSFSKIDYVYSR